jgi:hypothetical protein
MVHSELWFQGKCLVAPQLLLALCAEANGLYCFSLQEWMKLVAA